MKSENLGQEKIRKLLFKQATPAMIGMLVMSLYNVVDTIYIGRGVGTFALAGVSVSMPLIIILLSVSMAIGIGAASLVSRSLGAGNYEKVKEIFGNYLSLLFLVGIFAIVFGYVFLESINGFFGASSDIFPYAIDYSKVLILGAGFFLFSSSANNIIRASGNAKFAMSTMLIGALVNLIFDPILIFYFKLGVRGAAYSTVFSWFISSLYVLYYYFRINTVKISVKHLKFKIAIVKDIFAVGVSSFARQISAGIMTITVNIALAKYGSSMIIASFGILSRISMLTMMPIFGIVQGMQPIVGFNWGAKKFDRVKEVLFLSIKTSTFLSFSSFFILFLFSRQIISIFSSDKELLDFTNLAIKYIFIMLPLAGFQGIASGLYQSIGKARPAFILSILRQIILLVPLILILPIYYGLTGVLYSFPIADFLASVITFIFIYREIKIINKLRKANI